MTWKTWLLLIIAMVAGSVASYAVKSAFFDEKETPVVDESQIPGPKERILVANGFVPAGTELDASNVRLALTPEKDVPRDGVFSFAEFVGRKTTRDYKDGEPFSLYDVEAIEDNQAEDAAFVPPGYTVVPIEICSATKVNGSRNYLKTMKLERIVSPQDKIDFIVVKEKTSETSGSNLRTPQRRKLVSETIVKGASVLAVSDTSRLGEDGIVRQSTLSALLSPTDLEEVRKASEEGRLRIVLSRLDAETGEVGDGDPNVSPFKMNNDFTLPPQERDVSAAGTQNAIPNEQAGVTPINGISLDENPAEANNGFIIGLELDSDEGDNNSDKQGFNTDSEEYQGAKVNNEVQGQDVSSQPQGFLGTETSADKGVLPREETVRGSALQLKNVGNVSESLPSSHDRHITAPGKEETSPEETVKKVSPFPSRTQEKDSQTIESKSRQAVLDESSGSSEEGGEVKLHSPFVTVTKKPLPTSRKPRD